MKKIIKYTFNEHIIAVGNGILLLVVVLFLFFSSVFFPLIFPPVVSGGVQALMLRDYFWHWSLNHMNRLSLAIDENRLR